MKRYRHYDKTRAIILSCFGSVIEQEKYLDLKVLIEKEFQDCDVFLAFSSRMVLKYLQKQNEEFKNLAQVLADVDMLGYKHIIVSSVNIFPTDEHEYLKKIVNGFNSFSYANINYTNAIITKTKDTTDFFKDLNTQVSKNLLEKTCANLYIIHGTPKLDTAGIDSISYASEFLKALDDTNYTCSLEGTFPYYAIKDALKTKMQNDGIKNVQIIPLLLVSGNHYLKDMFEIKEDLSHTFKSSITKSLSKNKEFNLIELPKIKEIIITNIKEAFIMSGISFNKSTF